MRHSGAAREARFGVEILDVHVVVVCSFRSSSGMLAVSLQTFMSPMVRHFWDQI